VQTTLVRVIDDVPMGVAEGFVADDALDLVYFTEESRGIHKYHADPAHSVPTRIGFFGDADGAVPDLEGLALYARDDGSGFLVLSSQGNSTFLLYDRQGSNAYRATFRAPEARGTDGLDVTAAAVPGYPLGFALLHDDPGVRYCLFDWRDIEAQVLAPSPR
jgi:3-phytase